jgi:acetyl esterase/lipase
MNRFYLAASATAALYTLNAWRPRSLRNRWLAGPSFFLSWLTIELAWAHLLAQVATTAWFARRGVLRSVAGKLGLIINLVSWAGTAVLIWRSIEVRHEVRAVFGDPQPAPRHRLGSRVTRNLTYAQVDGRSLKLDVYQPRRSASTGERRPAILQIHGGAWVLGDKREQGLPLLRHLAGQGWVGFNANYRLSPKVTVFEQVVDLKRALVWIREHADEYGVDPDFVVVTGGSAGGHLAAMVALTAGDPSYQPGFEDADTTVQACVPFYGVYDLADRGGHYPDDTVDRFFGPILLRASRQEAPEVFAAASPHDQIHADAPPFLVIHGDLDTLVPVAMAQAFVSRLREVSEAPVVYLELRGAQHAFDVFTSIRGRQVIRAVDHFLGTLWAEYLTGRSPADVPAGELEDAVEDAHAGDVSV